MQNFTVRSISFLMYRYDPNAWIYYLTDLAKGSHISMATGMETIAGTICNAVSKQFPQFTYPLIAIWFSMLGITAPQ